MINLRVFSNGLRKKPKENLIAYLHTFPCFNDPEAMAREPDATSPYKDLPTCWG
jgi:hypothetical protein